ncbi:hypothetical protein RND71_000669 [Anisodus tanguticus]|uniref:RNase H type-1 domain-containing protein n=1 Tax=Anisodus tanguticus TaxID=243964 RepID=A0AAE1SZ99_9SOLA|nr:hypothetical protein RND71_000669 [Anisodus tanguticus]
MQPEEKKFFLKKKKRRSRKVLIKWWCADVKPRIQSIYYAVPSIIVWELWKRRNGDKHNKKVITNRVIYQVNSTIQQLVRLRKPGIKSVSHRWHDILQILENFIPKLQVTKVMWHLPPEGYCKCNTDGATRGNPGRSSFAFCVRDHLGNLVFARAKEMEDSTNTESEAMAILEAARYCLSKHVFSLILETDSLLMKNILDREWRPPWNIAFMVEELLEIIDNSDVQVLHILREGNQLADHLANVSLDHGEVEVQSFAELDTKGRKILNSDKPQCPYLRIRTQMKYTC